MDTPHSGSHSAPPPQRPKAAEPGGNPLLHIHKSGQGEYVRWSTAAGAGVLAVAFANFVYSQLGAFAAITLNAAENNQLIISVVGATVVLVVLGALIFRFVGQHEKTVDFLIATEGEMKKVNWSSRREVIGATKVVIFVTMALSFLLFAADLIFMGFFGAIGVLKLDLLGQLFGGGK